ncbi:MAG: hypothetical protein KME57_22640 [Scytonema hyalinum WJT4-NPBG1]|nr:hypothetical protein [Scytonema hyalinum WJT4-NPBG1]
MEPWGSGLLTANAVSDCLTPTNRSEFGEEFGEGSLEPLTRVAERGSAELTVEASRRSPAFSLPRLHKYSKQRCRLSRSLTDRQRQLTLIVRAVA